MTHHPFLPISKITRLPVHNGFSGGGRASTTPNYHAWTGLQVENSNICVKLHLNANGGKRRTTSRPRSRIIISFVSISLSIFGYAGRTPLRPAQSGRNSTRFAISSAELALLMIFVRKQKESAIEGGTSALQTRRNGPMARRGMHPYGFVFRGGDFAVQFPAMIRIVRSRAKITVA
jgi:hypothetical protein